MNILVWHVHGSWTTSIVQGRHTYLLPTGPSGGGRQGRDWPASAMEIPAGGLADASIDLVLAQSPEHVDVADQLGLPVIYVEHNTPKGDIPYTRHPMADRDDVWLVHVTHFNNLMWDSGNAPTTVIEHGIPDPGQRYSGEMERVAVVTNEPVRRGRITGTDLYPVFAAHAPIDVFGMGLAGLLDVTCIGDLRSESLFDEMCRRRVYLHLTRWTSLGLSLIEAMHLGMPVLALATTEASRAVPPDAGIVSADLDELIDGLRLLMAEPETARQMGKRAREHALAHYGLARFLREWDELLMEVST
ncbi:glycosyltransferase [Kibdelosporangium philippinense]|uniref:Glycosyltransferase n=1 Tax=Kibdelosporangium philippinense TaxID=211113 RepID=A0ABS8Z735_9PSEU|nr:glycosyltransferase [Kibdelosporangium philippinense]MCE7003694.1 glycosyltransferase [Kibdelosporangium philippinense]